MTIFRQPLGFFFGLLLVVPAAASAQQPAAPAPTFSKDVAPILYRSCVNCHRPGQIAPMSLLTYETARPWARSIKERVVQPRDAAVAHRQDGGHQGVQGRSVAERRRKSRRSCAGSTAARRRAMPADMPKAPTFPSDDQWSIGTPDLDRQRAEVRREGEHGRLVRQLLRGLGPDRGSLGQGDRSQARRQARRPPHHRLLAAGRRRGPRRRSCPSARTDGFNRRAGHAAHRVRDRQPRRRVPGRHRAADEGGREDSLRVALPRHRRGRDRADARRASCSIRRATSRSTSCRTSWWAPATSTSRPAPRTCGTTPTSR